MLKRTILICSLFCLLLSPLLSQFEIKTNVLGLVSNNYNGQVELLLNDKSGIELEASYRESPWYVSLSGSEITNSAFRTMMSYKYYVGGEDPTAGLYFGPYLKLKVAGLENIPLNLEDFDGNPPASLPEEVRVLNTAFFLGVNAGQKIVFNNNIIIEYYGGFGYALFNERTIRNDDIDDVTKDMLKIQTNSYTWPFDFRLGVTLGYRFWR